jgi:hypothetical protein
MDQGENPVKGLDGDRLPAVGSSAMRNAGGWREESSTVCREGSEGDITESELTMMMEDGA